MVVAGRYRIERELGRGGSAIVYLARDLRDERDETRVALKLLHHEFSGSKAAQRFQLEVRLLREFEHPHILPVTDAGEWEGRPYYAMPYVDGESLQERLKRERRLPFDEVVRIGQRLCEALAYAHARKVVHRDVKPANVMLAGDAVYLTDFGVAKALEPIDEAPHSTTGVARGTRAYMSPEQVAADRDLDHRSDIFSLGCVLYEMIAGVRPFYSADESRELMRRLVEGPDPLRRHRDGVPPALEAVVMKALAREPADRWQSVSEMGVGLGGGRNTETVAIRIRTHRRVASTLRAVRAHKLSIVSAVALGFTLAFWPYLPPRSRATLPPLDLDSTVAVHLIRLPGPALGEATEEALNLAWRRAMVRWTDVQWKFGSSESSLSEGVDRSREPKGSAGGGNLLVLEWGIEDQGNVLHLYARRPIRDPASPRHAYRFTIEPKGVPPVEALLAAALRPSELVDRPFSSDSATSSVMAWRAFGRAFAMARQGNWVDADSGFRMAAQLDPGYVEAWRYLILARLQKRRSSEPAARVAIVGLLRASEQRFGTARPVDLALLALVDGDYAGALRHLRSSPKSDDEKALADLLTAYANAWDDRIIRVNAAYVFRGSYAEASRAYARALRAGDAVIASTAFDGIRAVQPIQMTSLRSGWTVGPDSQMMAAYITLEHDSIAFRPRLLRDVASGDVGNLIDARMRALSRNRDALRRLAREWVVRFPRDGRAWEMVAFTAEMDGELASGDGETDAVSALARALQLESVRENRLRLLASQVRLHLKRSEWMRARLLVDSLLQTSKEEAPQTARTLAPLAALTGQAKTAVSLMTRGRLSVALDNDGNTGSFTPELRQAAARVFVLSALGTCDKSLQQERGRLDTLLTMQISAASLSQVRSILTRWALSLAYPCVVREDLLALDADADPLLEMQQQLARGERSLVRRGLDSLEARRRHASPGDIALDVTAQESSLLLAVGDSARARSKLSTALSALPTAGTSIVEEVAQAASLSRCMRLLRDLARADNDMLTARKWQSALDALLIATERGA